MGLLIWKTWERLSSRCHMNRYIRTDHTLIAVVLWLWKLDSNLKSLTLYRAPRQTMQVKDFIKKMRYNLFSRRSASLSTLICSKEKPLHYKLINQIPSQLQSLLKIMTIKFNKKWKPTWPRCKILLTLKSKKNFNNKPLMDHSKV